MGGVRAPSIADADILLAPNGLTLPRKASILHGQQHRLCEFAATFFGVGHSLVESFGIFREELIARET